MIHIPFQRVNMKCYLRQNIKSSQQNNHYEQLRSFDQNNDMQRQQQNNVAPPQLNGGLINQELFKITEIFKNIEHGRLANCHPHGPFYLKRTKHPQFRSSTKRRESSILLFEQKQVNRIQKTQGNEESTYNQNSKDENKNETILQRFKQKLNKKSTDLASQTKIPKKIVFPKLSSVANLQMISSSLQKGAKTKLSISNVSKLRTQTSKHLNTDEKRSTRYFKPFLSKIKKNQRILLKIKPQNELFVKQHNNQLFTGESVDRKGQACNTDQKNQLKGSTSGNQSQKRCLKIQPKLLSKQQLIQNIKQMAIEKQTKLLTVFDKQWRQKTFQNQSYCCEFYFNDKLAGLAITSLLPSNIFRIQLWASYINTSQTVQSYCLDKYLQYLTKCSTHNQIQFKGKLNKLMQSYGFVHRHSDLYSLSIQAKQMRAEYDIQSFLSLKCSNLSFKQQKNGLNLLQSDQIQPFSVQNHYIHEGLSLCKKQMLKDQLAMHVKISDKINDLHALNTLLQDENLDAYFFDPRIVINDIKALRLNLNATFLSPFVCSNNSFKLKGQEIHKSDKEVICKFNCFTSNIKMYLSKGISIDRFKKLYVKEPVQQKDYAVKFFTKQLYGRLPIPEEEAIYGYWQINLFFKDTHFGKITHDFSHLQSFGPQPFLVSLQIEGELCYMFYVNQGDIL